MKLKNIFALSLGLLLLSSCDKKDTPEVKKEGKELTVTLDKRFEDYSDWVYVDLKSGKQERHRDFSKWNYYKPDATNMAEAHGANSIGTFVKSEDAKGSIADVKIDWDIALHLDNVGTNGLSALETNETELSKVVSLPTDVAFEEDIVVKDKILVDLSGMMNGSGIGYSAEAKVNPALEKAVFKTSMTDFKDSNKVYLIKLKSGKHIKIKFKMARVDNKKIITLNYDFL